ncbi:hypothetical protein R9X47_22070 [Wukongibacter baidiensis]|uniref:hypothetical protein n=1 Tax=Wukongibacter baidiensis TaxID=1723361 RepID=UPI003D7FEA45
MKKLVTKRNVHDFLIEGEDKFYVDSSTIIAPGAKDILRNKGIVIVYGEREEAKTNEPQKCDEVSNLDDDKQDEKELKIIKIITNLLADEFNISDVDEIKEVTSKVLKRINE